MNAELIEILSIESNKTLLSDKYSYRNVHFWPLIRPDILTLAIEDKYNFISIKHNSISNRNKWHLFKYVIYSYFFNPLKINKKYDIVIFGSDVTNVKLKNEKKYINRIYDSFANENKNTIIIEESSNFGYKRPRQISNIAYLDWIRIKARIKSKFIKDKTILANVDDFFIFLKTNFKYLFSDLTWANLKEKLIVRIYELEHLQNSYEDIFKKTKPKLVMVNGGCYGSYAAILIDVCHKLNINVAEFQHGTVSDEHIGYNFHPDLSNKYLKYLPDFFLCYGEYWKKQITLPIKILPIGNPYLSENVSNKCSVSKDDILVYISSGLNPNKDIEFVLELQQVLHKINFKIYFRPHPLELKLISERYSKLIDSEIVIDNSPLYEVLKRSKFVVGEVSTVLFEAIMFDNIVIVLDTPYTKSIAVDFIYKALTPIDILNIVNNNLKMKYDITYYWKENWQDNYKHFLNSCFFG